MGDAVLNVAICDSEPSRILPYSRLLYEATRQNGISAQIRTFATLPELFAAWEDDHFDLLYLDVALARAAMADMAQKIRLLHTPTDILALSGFPESARFTQNFLSAVTRIRKQERAVISFRSAGETCRVPVPDILYFEVQNYLVTVHHKGGSFEFVSTLGKVEAALTGQKFVRAHRSFLLALRALKTISRSTALLCDGTDLPVGRQYWDQVRQSPLPFR